MTKLIIKPNARVAATTDEASYPGSFPLAWIRGYYRSIYKAVSAFLFAPTHF